MAGMERCARVAAPLAPAVPLAVMVGEQVHRGWVPTSDDAAIAWRTYDVFSAHAPLLGAYNDASIAAHPTFDVGPLQFFLLALPDRIDPVHGILWGSALLTAVIAGVSVEAAWRAGRSLAGLAVAAAFCVMFATQAVAVINLPWNPNLGMFAFSGALVGSMVAASGRTAWWPFAVACGCLAAECHLVFGVASVIAVVVAIAAGLLGRRRAGRPIGGGLLALGAGVAVGVLGLLPPVVQQLSDRDGNLSALLHNLGHQGRTRGLASGFAAIARVSGFPPAWTHSVPAIGTLGRDVRFFAAVFDGSSAVGVTIVIVVAAAGAVALALGRQGFGATALVSAGAAAGLAWTLGAVATAQTAVLTYVDVALWPVGIALDVSLVWGVVELARAVLPAPPARRPASADDTPSIAPATRPTHLRPDPDDGDDSRANRRRLVLVLASLGVVGTVVWSSLTMIPAASKSNAVIGGWLVSRAVGPVAGAIAREAPHDVPFVVEPSVHLFPSGLPSWSLAEAVAYRLKTMGFDVRLLPPTALELGGDATAPRGAAAFEIVPGAKGHWSVRRLRRAVPTTILAFVLPTPVS